MLKFPIVSILFIFIAFLMFVFFILGNFLINDPATGLVKTFNDMAPSTMSGDMYTRYVKAMAENATAFGVIAVIYFALAFMLVAFESLKSTNER
jgi:hypothetical protein